MRMPVMRLHCVRSSIAHFHLKGRNNIKEGRRNAHNSLDASFDIILKEAQVYYMLLQFVSSK